MKKAKKITTKLKIGITLALKSNEESIWSNGMKQNVLFFADMLQRSKKEYDVYILNVNELDFEKKPTYMEGFNFCYFDTNFMDMDIIFMMGAQVHDSKIKKFKEQSKDKKYVGYKCGNNYIISLENMLFKDVSKNYYEYEKTFDECWYVPQQHETNQGYFTTLYRANSFSVPFIWHHRYLKESVEGVERSFKAGSYKRNWKYDNTKKQKMVGIMEPNMNVVKFSIIPAFIAEQSYRGKIGKEHIEGLMISNARDGIAKNKEYLSIISSLDLYKDGKVSAEARYQTAYFLTQYLDVLICHQLLNPLNYLYIDAVYLGYPVIHNAPLCKDLGYYYEGSDTVAGAKLLDYVLTEHDNNLEAYDEKNDKVLQRYHAENEEIIKTYDKLIENLFNGGNPDNLDYNWKTNLYNNMKIK